jgi:hypothetical protein
LRGGGGGLLGGGGRCLLGRNGRRHRSKDIPRAACLARLSSDHESENANPAQQYCIERAACPHLTNKVMIRHNARHSATSNARNNKPLAYLARRSRATLQYIFNHH